MPGDRWMIRGPLEYVPPVEVDVVTKRKAIPLDENEGIYVRDIKTGKVTIVHCTLGYPLYMYPPTQQTLCVYMYILY